MDEQHRVKVEIFGYTYTLRGPAHPEHLQRIAAVVDKKMQEIYEKNPQLDLQTLAVLTALNMADAYEGLLMEYEALIDSLELQSHQEDV